MLLKKKRVLEDLAIFGGPPTFQDPLHVGRPNIGSRDRFYERLNDLLDRRWLSNDGPYVQAFEKRIAEITGVAHCIATCNATHGLSIAIKALGLSGEVIVPSFTFIASAHALYWLGIQPVFCDLDPETHNLDPDAVESHITPRTSGIMGVHVWGRPCAIEQLTRISKQHSLSLLFDAAHAFGCTSGDVPIGGFGDAEVFSFHATKYVNSFEGGAVVTNDDALADKLRLLRNFGFQGFDEVITLGTNVKMNEASAAMGLTNLESMDDFIEHNRMNYEYYREALAGVRGISLLEYDESNKNNYQYLIMEVDSSFTGIRRDVLVDLLHHENVLARRYFYPGCHRMEPYATLYPDSAKQLPETERLVERVLSLPTGSTVSKYEIDQVCELIRFAIIHGEGISRGMIDLP